MPIFKTPAGLLQFFHVPKCAGTSIISYLTTRFGSPCFYDPDWASVAQKDRWSRTSPQHATAFALGRLFPVGFIDHKFAIVRHPAQRLVSAFHFQRNHAHSIPADTEFANWLPTLPDLLAQDASVYDGHFAPMAQFVPEDVDYFRLEEGLAPFVGWIDHHIGPSKTSIDIGWQNATRADGRQLGTVLGKKELDLIDTLYAEDFQRFGYATGGEKRKVLPLSVTQAQRFYQSALAEHRGGDLDAARALLVQATQMLPDFAEAIAALSFIHLLLDERQLAEDCARRALALKPVLEDPYHVLIRRHLQDSQVSEARAALTAARRHIASALGLDLHEVMVLVAENRHEQALTLCADIISAHPARIDAQQLWASTLSAFRRSAPDAFTALYDAMGLITPHVHSAAPITKSPAVVDLVVLADTYLQAEDILAGLADTDLQSVEYIHLFVEDQENGDPDKLPNSLQAKLNIAPERDIRSALDRILAQSAAATVAWITAPCLLQSGWVTELDEVLHSGGWSAIGPTVIAPSKPDQPIASEPLSAAVKEIFALTSAAEATPMLTGKVMLTDRSATIAALAFYDGALLSVESVVPALSLAMTDLGRGVARWIGVQADTPATPEASRTPVGQALGFVGGLQIQSLDELCQSFGGLRFLLAATDARFDSRENKLRIALLAAGCRDRSTLLLAMLDEDQSLLPTALRYEALAETDPSNLQSAIASCIALERGFHHPTHPPLTFPEVAAPCVSIIIPALNNVGATYCTLSALLLARNTATFEVILVDDGSTDATRDLGALVKGIRIVRNETPRMFIAACNAGVAASRGKFIVLLNNDTEPTTGWLDSMLDAFRLHPSTGAVGSRLIFPDGHLQDAGGLVNSLGDPANYGSGGHPLDPRFAYSRPADYLSGAALMLPRTVWDKVGGLSSYLQGMYFEDTDLAFKVRAVGMVCRYTPTSIVIHYEGTTAGRDIKQGPKALQELNRPLFKARWAQAFTALPSPECDADLARDHTCSGRVLFIDYATPRPDNDAGGHASFEEMQMIMALGYKVSFIDVSASYATGYTEALQEIGVEPLYAPFVASPEDAIRRFGNSFDVFYISRYWIAAQFVELVRTVNPRAVIILNNADLHHLRMMREAVLNNDEERMAAARAVRMEELDAMRSVDLVLTYSDVEKSVIWAETDGEVAAQICPWVEDIKPNAASIEGRHGLSFLGGFGHPPNGEGISWFAAKVMPLLSAATTDTVRLSVYGSSPTPAIMALSSPEITVHGYVADVTTCFAGHRIFVAPLLAGAGLKGKVIKALCHGIPCVLSPIAAEGIGLVDEIDCLIAETPEDWCKAILRLLRDDDLWRRLSAAGLSLSRRKFSHEAGVRRMAQIFDSARSSAKLTVEGPSVVAPGKLLSADDISIYFEIQHFGDIRPVPWLVNTLSNPRHQINVSYDGPSALLSQLATELAPNLPQLASITVQPSQEVRWCGPSLVLQTISSIRLALAIEGWDYLANVSGVCAPLRPMAELHRKLAESHSKGIRAHCFLFPVKETPEIVSPSGFDPIERDTVGRMQLLGPRNLLQKFHDDKFFPLINPMNRPFIYCSEPASDRNILEVRPLSKDELILRKSFFARRTHYCGRAWHVLHRSACEALINYLDSSASEDLRQIFLTMLVPEESLLQTVLGNGLAIPREQVSANNFYHVQADPRNYYDEHAVQLLADTDAYFVRKIAASGSDELRGQLARRVIQEHEESKKMLRPAASV